MRQSNLSKLWLLLKKNLILRKRQYVVTGLEIILPTIVAILVAYIRAKLGPTDGGSSEFVREQFFPPASEEELINFAQSAVFRYSWGDQTNFVGYTPNTDAVKKFLEEELHPQLLNNSAYNLTWQGFDSEKEIEVLAAEQGLNFGGGGSSPRLVLALAINGLLPPGGVYPAGSKISYKIRVIDEFYDTTELMPWIIFGAGDCYDRQQYKYSGFSGLQVMIDKLLTSKLTGRETDYTISTGSFPCPGDPDGFDFNQIYFILLPQLLTIGFIFIVPSIVRTIVSEKETGIKELMKMTGLPNWMHWVAWMLNSMFILVISITIVVIIFFIPFNSARGAVLKNSDPSLWWFVLIVYAIWATSYCFLISSMFQRPTLATTVGVVVWLITYNGVAVPLEPRYVDLSLTSKLLLCLSPNMGLHYALKLLSGFEAKEGIGAQWKNIATPVSSVDSLTLLHVVAMLVVASIVYLVLAMYLESVLPTKYGVPKPWYFIFMPATWGIGKAQPEVGDYSILRNAGTAAENEGFERVAIDLRPGMEILQLSKEFGGKVVVDNLSVTAYEGQIFCLLGHNGAGKTTTMSILTGILAPSGGTALINNKDIRTDMDGIRQDLGLCPQHNLLFSKLTVAEHLRFFGMVKELKSSEVDVQVTELIRKLHLQEKTDELAMSLSGGQKRRLSLGCAIVGGSKVLFLDECSSGLDPEARRIIWDLLLEIRGHRTIILTTHFLEEADVLGDRVAIMANGKIQCCGSPLFLKKHYGTGYTLTVSMAGTANPMSILQIIQRHIPSAHVKSEIRKGEVIELEISLTSAQQNNTSVFPALFSDILSQKQILGVLDVGITLTTMDEVFLKVEELGHHSENESQSRIPATMPNKERMEGGLLYLQQLWSFLLKKMLYSTKRWKLLATQMVLPVLLIIAAVLITNVTYNAGDRTPPLVMSLSSYKDPITLYTASANAESQEIGNSYRSFVGSSARQLDNSKNLSLELLDISLKEEESYFQRYIVAAELDTFDLNAMYSAIPQHSSPLAVNLVSNAMLQYLAPDQRYTLEVTNHPLTSRASEIFDAASDEPLFSEVAPFVVGILVSIGLALLAASFIVMPIEERKCKAKQLQLMTGVNPLIYWGAAFLWDFFVTLTCVAVMVACLFIFEKHEGFTNNGGAGVAFLIMMVEGFGAILFSQLLSLVSQTPAGGFTLVTILHIITGTLCGLGSFILESIPLTSASNTIGWIARLFPTYGASKSLMVFAQLSTKNSRCNALSDDIKNILCKTIEGFPQATLYQSCCDNCQELGAECHKPEEYLVWSRRVQTSDGGFDEAPKFISLPGIAQEITFMLIMAGVYCVILMLIEFGGMKRILNIIWKQKDVDFAMHSNDEDVRAETERVQSITRRGATSENAIVVDNFCKSYGTFSAVSKLTFGVQHGECFGLLGVNGAGKTTSFKMLTGDEIISNGDAWIGRESIQTDRKKFLSRIGYCPQFDGIIGVLSGKQMLEMFARLRGVKNSDVASVSQMWLDRFGLSESADVQCQKYSGGMKRRLSAAMALIGDPPIILLDEPTSGVDPVSRRQFWSIISSLKNAGRSIILTSHSMEECEHLCNNMGIMVNGELQCLGRVQHLKNKFAQGYTLTIRSKQGAQGASGDPYFAALVHHVTTQLEPCSLKDHHQNVTQFHIQSTTMQLDKIFHVMEGIKFQFQSYIEEYSVQQTTLEEVFLSFARKQYNMDRAVQTSGFRRLVSCIFGY